MAYCGGGILGWPILLVSLIGTNRPVQGMICQHEGILGVRVSHTNKGTGVGKHRKVLGWTIHIEHVLNYGLLCT